MAARLVNGRYALTSTVRPGGMSDVFLATDLDQGGRRVAVKLFKEELTESGLLEEAFRRESQALKDLHHPRIVQLLDSGRDGETHRHFLVLEWLEQDLTGRVSEQPFPGWDDFYNDFGRHILEALAFAHTRQVIHRDIKPKNILIDDGGLPKLVDFGIAKIKQWVQPAHTLQDWVSRPFCPPEWDDGSFTYTRDVYGFATIVLSSLVDGPLKTYEDIDHAYEKLDAPDEILQIIQKCLSKNPSERYANAIVLLEAIDHVQEERSEAWRETVTYYLRLTDTALANLRRSFPGETDSAIKDLILRDLRDICGFAPRNVLTHEGVQEVREGHYELYGASLRYGILIDLKGKSQLTIRNAWKSSPSRLEANREKAFTTKCRFLFGEPPHSTVACEQLGALVNAIEEHQAQWHLLEAERKEQEVYQTWNRILIAKSEIERSRESPIKYRQWERDGNRILFQIPDLIEEDLIGQPRRVDLDQRPILFGEIEAIEEDWVVLYITRQFEDHLPQAGKLLFDDLAAQIAIKRQKDSLDAIRFQRSLRPDLRRLLARPAECRAAEPAAVENFIQKDLDETKQRIVKLACGLEDFLLVEGPPGTGKTTFIAETVLQYLRAHPSARILLTSQTHVALDNAAERISSLSRDIKILRLGVFAEERIAEGVRGLLLPNQMEKWRQEVVTKSRQFLNEWASKRGISKHDFKVGRALQEYIVRTRELKEVEDHLLNLKNTLEEMTGATSTGQEDPDDLRELRVEVGRLESEVRQKKGERKEIEKNIRELEALAGEILEGPEQEIKGWVDSFIPDSATTREFNELSTLQTEWENRFGKGPEFQAALIASAQVIAGTCIGVVGVKSIQDIGFDLCIVDEASKATPTELLVPLSRGRKWIIVGDRKQLPPFVDEALGTREILSRYDLKSEDVQETLFDRLLEQLPEQCKTRLVFQHRMVPPIGNLISNCFYDGLLQSAPKQLDDSLSKILPRPVVWMTTAHLSNQAEVHEGPSFSNPCEAQVAVRLVDKINLEAVKGGRRFTVCVLSGYLAQVNVLRRQTSYKSHLWAGLDIECNTVDAFQGREADIAIYCVTRSNQEGNIGFLRDFRRLNVALSRGKKYLIVIGNHFFARRASGPQPFSAILDHIDKYPDQCQILNGTL